MKLVARNHNIPLTTISTWMRKRKQRGGSSRGPKSENFNSVKAGKEVEKENISNFIRGR
jgi:transposase-like protein